MTIPKNSKDVEGMRAFVNGLKAQFCSLQSVYSGVIRQLVDNVVAAADAVIAKLPTGEVKSDWNADDALQCLCSCLTSANAVLTQVSLELNKLQQSMASAVTAEIEKQITEGALVRKDAVTAQVDAAITERTSNGELVPKDQVNQLCSAAKLNGEQAGRAALQAELDQKTAAETTATARKATLTAAGKPLPPAQIEAVLRLSEEDFKAAEAKFDARLQKLTAAGYNLTPELSANCWLDEAGFAVFEKTVNDIPSLKAPPAEPFAKPGTGEKGARKLPAIA